MVILAIVQARLGSIRFPNKVIQKIGKLSLIEILLRRLRASKFINKKVLATTLNIVDDTLVQIVSKLDCEIYRGEENDVLDRYYQNQ